MSSRGGFTAEMMMMTISAFRKTKQTGLPQEGLTTLWELRQPVDASGKLSFTEVFHREGLCTTADDDDGDDYIYLKITTIIGTVLSYLKRTVR